MPIDINRVPLLGPAIPLQRCATIEATVFAASASVILGKWHNFASCRLAAYLKSRYRVVLAICRVYCSFQDPWRFDTDQGPRIRASVSLECGSESGLLSRVAFKIPTKSAECTEHFHSRGLLMKGSGRIRICTILTDPTPEPGARRNPTDPDRELSFNGIFIRPW